MHFRPRFSCCQAYLGIALWAAWGQGLPAYRAVIRTMVPALLVTGGATFIFISRGLRDRTRSPHDRPLHRSTASRRGLAKIRPTSRRHACSLDLGFAVQRPSAFWCGSGCWRSQSATALRVLRIGRAADTYDGPGCVTRPAAGSPGARLLVPHAILPHTASAVIANRLVLPTGLWYRARHEPSPRFATDARAPRDAGTLASSRHHGAARGVAEPHRVARR